MEKVILTAFVLISNFLNAQSVKEMLEADSAVWFGMDFTKAKLIGDFSHPSTDAKAGELIVRRWIPEWNVLMNKELWNFDIATAIQKPKLRRETELTAQLNAQINPDSIHFEEPVNYKFKDPDKQIGEMLLKYHPEKYKAGLGCVFIVESFNRKAVNANVYFVLFDIATKKLIGYKRFMGNPKGGGIRNYWAGAIKVIIEQVTTTGYNAVKWNALKSK